MPAIIGLALALRGASKIPMLRSHALVLLALAAFFVPPVAAHTRPRPGTSPARASARGLHREGSASPAASRRDRARSATRSSSRTQAKTAQLGRSRKHPGQLAHAKASRDPRRANRRGRNPDRQPVHLSRRDLARDRRRNRHLASNTRQIPQDAATGRSATPGDFLDAASAQPSRDRNHQATSQPPSRQPVGVVSLIRRSADHPQLEPIPEAAADPLILPQLPTDRTHRGILAPLYGSHEILVHQNLMADRDGLDRILNDDDLLDKRRSGQLVPIPESAALHVDERLPPNRRFCRPWVAQFLATMAEAHYARFHTPLQVNSAVRTVEFQHHLLRVNGNAAPAEGDTASPHLTGQAVDIAKRWMPIAEISWLRGYLLPLIEGGRIDVEEEFQQACFHISAYHTAAPLPIPGSPGRYLATEAPGVPTPAAWSAATR